MVLQWTIGRGQSRQTATQVESIGLQKESGRVNTQEIDVLLKQIAHCGHYLLKFPVQCVQLYVCLISGLFVFCKESKNSFHNMQR